MKMCWISVAVDSSEYGQEWHKNWIVIDNDDEGRPLFKAFEPDNTCIYTGVKIDDACKALNNCIFGE